MKKIKHAGKTALALCSILALLAGCGKAAATNSGSGSMDTTSSSAGTLTALDSAAVNASSESGTSGTESTASAAGSTGSAKNESPDSSAAPADPTSAPESPAAPSEDPAGIDFVSTETSLYTYEQMMTDLSEMAAAYPDLLTVRSCGTSLDGREIPEAILGNPESAHHILIQRSTRGSTSTRWSRWSRSSIFSIITQMECMRMHPMTSCSPISAFTFYRCRIRTAFRSVSSAQMRL